MASNYLVSWRVPDAFCSTTNPPNSLIEPVQQTKAEATLVTMTEPTTSYTISFASYFDAIHDMPGITRSHPHLLSPNEFVLTMEVCSSSQRPQLSGCPRCSESPT